MALRSGLLISAIMVTALGCQAKNSGGSSKRPAATEPVTPTTTSTTPSTSGDACAVYTSLQTCTAVVGCAWNGTKCATAPVNTTPGTPDPNGGMIPGGNMPGGNTTTYCTAFNTQELCAAGPGCMWNGTQCSLTGLAAAPTPTSCSPFKTQNLCAAGLSCAWNAAKNQCLRPSVGLGTPFLFRDGLSNVGAPANQMINCSFSALMGTDGNFVVYQGSQPIWSTRTAGGGGVKVTLQGDGNLVMTNAANAVIWSSVSANKGGIGMLLSTSGTLAIVNGNGVPIWTSGLTVPGCN
jgi:hypothetical protein